MLSAILQSGKYDSPIVAQPRRQMVPVEMPTLHGGSNQFNISLPFFRDAFTPFFPITSSQGFKGQLSYFRVFLERSGYGVSTVLQLLRQLRNLLPQSIGCVAADHGRGAAAAAAAAAQQGITQRCDGSGCCWTRTVIGTEARRLAFPVGVRDGGGVLVFFNPTGQDFPIGALG